MFLKSYLAFLFLSVPVICTVLWTLYSSILEALIECRFWQWQNYLHKFVINLFQWCEDVFLNHVSKSLLWSSRPIDLGFFLLNGRFFFYNTKVTDAVSWCYINKIQLNWTDWWFGHSLNFAISDRRMCMYVWHWYLFGTQVESYSEQLPNASSANWAL